MRVGSVSPIVISRSYNSLDGLWRHSFSSHLYFGTGAVVVVHADGRESVFSLIDDIYLSKTDSGVLVALKEGWSYRDPSNATLIFSAQGRLLRVEASNGSNYDLTYSRDGGHSISISNSVGDVVMVQETLLHQLLEVSGGSGSVAYEYDSQILLKRTITKASNVSSRKYHYEDSRNASWLTGITDERGIRFATWAYDAKGRAISSQHSGGAGLTQITYNVDGSSTVTNELGKQALYRYQQISGVKRITSIEGEPSPNCSASNSSYTYNDRGQVLIKTDAKGLITTYTYNDRGLETSRIEANGTSLARTITTEWDANRFLPLRVVEPTRTTVYSYDSQRRELSRQTTSH
ncbi:RHS repeat domain-containing protein [Pseudomonas sp. Irchel 3A5]|uniref:RHS repeat domain-containing protein n=1 Tax=Pseudomonas sp. Irchel 3A5 TaxID=2008911 RepID=UPI003530D67C